MYIALRYNILTLSDTIQHYGQKAGLTDPTANSSSSSSESSSR